MKKSIAKSLSVFLALVLILSVLPMAAFAAEFNESEHTDECYFEGGVATRAVLICPGGNHVYMATTSVVFVDCVDDHRVDEVIMYECANCAHSYYEETGRSYHEDHYYYIRIPAGIDPISGVNIYYYVCACGSIG